MKISQQTFQNLDVDKDNKITKAELLRADSRPDQIISATEAKNAGISPQDRSTVTEAIKYYADLEPREVVFSTPNQSKDPAKFTSGELSDLKRRYGMKAEQPLFNKGAARLTNASPVGHIQATTAVTKNHHVIDLVAAKYKINPLLLAAVVYDETLYALPVGENSTSKMSEDWRQKPGSYGITQVGTPELLRHKYLDRDIAIAIRTGQLDSAISTAKNSGKIPRSAKRGDISPSQLMAAVGGPDKFMFHLPQTLRDKGYQLLTEGREGEMRSIKVLGQQLRRLSDMQKFDPNHVPELGTYKDERQIVMMTNPHNGYADYGGKILQLMNSEHLKNAYENPSIATTSEARKEYKLLNEVLSSP